MKLTPKQKKLIDAMQTTTDMQQLRKILNYNSRNLMCMIKRLHNKKYVIKLKKGVYEINPNHFEIEEKKQVEIADMEIKHKVTARQIQLIEAMKITGNLKELQAMLKWRGRELHNMIGYLNQRKFINRVKKSVYELNYDYIYSENSKSYQPVQIDGWKIDLNIIPEDVREFIWENRQMTCSQLKLITKLPRFYIRQYIYERKIRELPRLKEY